jgi:thiamine biosynthesis lipoprotein ApbE
MREFRSVICMKNGAISKAQRRQLHERLDKGLDELEAFQNMKRPFVDTISASHLVKIDDAAKDIVAALTGKHVNLTV